MTNSANEKAILMMFDRKSSTTKMEVTATTITRSFQRDFKKGRNTINKQMGIMILEYNSLLVANARGISKKPKGNKYLITNLKIILAIPIFSPKKKANGIRENAKSDSNIAFQSQ